MILGVILLFGPTIFHIQISIDDETNSKHYSIFFQAFVLMQIFN